MMPSIQAVLDRSRAVKMPDLYDVTLRDGNQALRQPWSPEIKNGILSQIYGLGIRKAELGFPSSNEGEFDAVSKLAAWAPHDMTVGALAAATAGSIKSAADALACSRGAKRRLHTFLAMSPKHMEHVLRKEPVKVREMAVLAVSNAVRDLFGSESPSEFEVQFSPEHFGDCVDNLDWVIASLLEIVDAGVTIINLPNTVERRCPALFAAMVKEVTQAMPEGVTVNVHCHNDGGMAVATTLTAVIDGGATGIEATLNGLGSRCGNADLFQVVMGLYQEGVDLSGINFELFQEAALTIERESGIPIPEKAPYFGADAFVNREGIHQAGVERTRDQDHGAYRRIRPEMIGRTDRERCEFTNQSGSVVLQALLREGGELVEREVAQFLVKPLKRVCKQFQPLSVEELVAVYQAYQQLMDSKDDVSFRDVEVRGKAIIGLMRGCHTWVFEHGEFHSNTNGGSSGTATITLSKDGRLYSDAATDDGAIAAAAEAIRRITCSRFRISHFHASSVDGNADAQAEVTLRVWIGDKHLLGIGVDTNTDAAATRAIINGLNRHLAEKVETQG